MRPTDSRRSRWRPRWLRSELLLLVALLPAVAPAKHAQASFVEVVGAVWVPGLGSALGSVGFGAVTTFVVLLFAARGWANGWAAYTAYAVAFILARVFFSHLADSDRRREGRAGLRAIEAVGQALIWLAVRPEVALAGAALTGFGFSLVYPGFGVEAVRRVPAQSRGLAMGAYTAFLDLAQGLASPALGLIAAGARLNALFLVSVGHRALRFARRVVADREPGDLGRIPAMRTLAATLFSFCLFAGAAAAEQTPIEGANRHAETRRRPRRRAGPREATRRSSSSTTSGSDRDCPAATAASSPLRR